MTSVRRKRERSLRTPLKQSPRNWLRVRGGNAVAPQQRRAPSELRRRKSRRPLKSRQQRRPRRRRLLRKRLLKSNDWRRLWVKKFIHTVFDSATTKTGIRIGLRRNSSANFCSKI